MNENKNLTIEETFKLAVENHQNNKLDVAQELYNKVLEINPNFRGAHFNLGLLFQNTGDYQKAKDCYEKAIEIDPVYLNAYINLGGIFDNLKEYQKAINCYEKAIKIDPNNFNAHYNLGNMFKELEQHQKAINSYEKAIEINPNFTAAHNNLGAVFFALGDHKKAINCYKKAIEIDPNHELSLYNLGVAQHSCNQFKNAAEQFRLSNFKNSKSFLLNCFYQLDDEFSFFEELDNQIKQGKTNAIIGSLTSRSEIKYGIKKPNLFCEDPLKYVLKTDLTEQYNFKDVFVNPIKDFLKEEVFPSRQQNLLTNGQQTAGNLFSVKNDYLKNIEDIIHIEVNKYRDHFKDSNEGFLKKWPTNYYIKGWLVNMKNGGKLAPHIHETGWLSGSIYINVPPKSKVDSGNLVVCIDDKENEAKIKIDTKKIINVVTGSLCLFPSSLHHYTVPFESKEDRIVLAFDVTPS